MKKTLVVAAFIQLFLLLAIPCNAAEFGSDSANINHLYFPLKSGASKLMVGYGSDAQQFEYTHIAGIETVDGVKCGVAFTVRTQTSEFTKTWIAKDTLDDLYILKYWDGLDPAPVVLGKAGAVLLMPKNPQIGNIIDGGDLTVVATGVTVPQLSTGLGPFTNCIQAVDEEGDMTYFAPGLWDVKVEDSGASGGWELKEYILPKTGVVVIPLP